MLKQPRLQANMTKEFEDSDEEQEFQNIINPKIKIENDQRQKKSLDNYIAPKRKSNWVI